MKRATETTDIGCAIRDLCHCEPVSHIDTDGDQTSEEEGADFVSQIDITDPSNLVFHMESGAQFTVRIVRTG